MKTILAAGIILGFFLTLWGILYLAVITYFDGQNEARRLQEESSPSNKESRDDG